MARRRTSKSRASKSQTRKLKRPSPSESATQFAVGHKKRGNDGNVWAVIQTRTAKRWKLESPYKRNQAQKDYMRACTACEKSRANPHRTSFDCETMIYNNNAGLASNAYLKMLTKFYKDGVKTGKLDWGVYNNFKSK
tara:strand:- start:838 stop:1248 length:411 start_codon:yes stop_codon:yes gene_type:complete